MKDNLVQKLDLLETQLVRLESKDAKQPALGKLSRTKYLLEKLEKSGGLSQDAQALREEIIHVKHKIVNRKIHYASNIIQRFLKQFKKIEPLRIAKRLKSVTEGDQNKKQHLEEELEYVNTYIADQLANDIVIRGLAKRYDVKALAGISYSKDALEAPAIRVLSRIGKNDTVRNAISQLVESAAIYSSEQPPQADGTSHASNAINTTNKTTIADDEFTQFPVEDEEIVEKAPEVDTFFEQSTIPVNYDDISDEDEGMSNGLPLLNQGYISGSEDEEDTFEPAPQPERRNRRGQRARRKIWEQKYGRRANHVIKEQREEQKKQEEKENRKRRRAEKEAAVKRQKSEFASKPLHPSWEAHQKQKEKLEQMKFEGKKMKFD